jgi:hypothetical protein
MKIRTLPLSYALLLIATMATTGFNRPIPVNETLKGAWQMQYALMTMC